MSDIRMLPVDYWNMKGYEIMGPEAAQGVIRNPYGRSPNEFERAALSAAVWLDHMQAALREQARFGGTDLLFHGY